MRLVAEGVPQGATASTLVATFNDLANVEELIKGGDVAAVILEPVVGNSGYIPPTKVRTLWETVSAGFRSRRRDGPQSIGPCSRT